MPPEGLSIIGQILSTILRGGCFWGFCAGFWGEGEIFLERLGRAGILKKFGIPVRLSTHPQLVILSRPVRS